jgi:hypothetical protein
MKFYKQALAALATVLLASAVSVSLAREIRITRRLMTKQEFNRLKEKEGVYEEGKNYNIIIDGHGTGLRPPTEAQWKEIRRMPVLVDRIESARKATPSNHDNSATIWFPPIGTQDGEGSCVSWACVYYTKTFQEAKEHNWDLSGCVWEGDYYGYPSIVYQDRIFSPDFIYHQANGGEDGGSYYIDNMNLLERIGCCTWEKMPYDPTNSTTWPDEDAWKEAPWYRSLTGHTIMWVDTDPALEDLKQLLADTNLVVISINAGYYGDLTSEDLWTLDNYDPISTNHANTVVGYDDDYGPYDEGGDPNTYGAFKVANSWLIGGWENVDDGFYYISYECMKQRVERIFFYENRVNYEPEMISVFRLSHKHRGECKTAVGIGDISSPDSIKQFHCNMNGGEHPFPSHIMVMDVTGFAPYITGPSDNFFLEIYDTGTDTTGTIDSFSIEIYDDYASGVPVETHASPSPPVNTVNFSPVYAATSPAPAIRFVRHTVNDSRGNNDGNADAGETVELWLTLDNLSLDATNVSGELSSEDPYLSIDIAAAGYGDILSREERTSLTAYRCSVHVACPDPHVAMLGLEISADGAYSTVDSLHLIIIGDAIGFSDDMESGTGGWSHQVVTFGYSDQWHQSNWRCQSEITSWKFGDQGVRDYVDYADGGLITPPFLLGPSSKLSFRHWIDAEIEDDTTAWDGGVVMLSVDNGDWSQISPLGGYPCRIIQLSSNPLAPATPCFSGTQGWQLAEFDLSGYEGVAQVMFRFGSDGNVSEEGWYIDDVLVEGAPCGDVNGEGRITFADALYLKNYYYQTPPGSPAPIGSGDVNLDGNVTFADALYIKNYYYQTPPGSPDPCNPPQLPLY